MKKLLIVEDEPMLLEIYQKKFSQAGYFTKTAKNGTEAMAKIAKNSFDLILLDLILPEEDGFDILKKIKADPDSRDLKVFVFSNLNQQEDRQKATQLGAEGFITKSDYTPKQMVEKVNDILGFEPTANNENSEEKPTEKDQQSESGIKKTQIDLDKTTNKNKKTPSK